MIAAGLLKGYPPPTKALFACEHNHTINTVNTVIYVKGQDED